MTEKSKTIIEVSNMKMENYDEIHFNLRVDIDRIDNITINEDCIPIFEKDPSKKERLFKELKEEIENNFYNYLSSPILVSVNDDDEIYWEYGYVG